MHDVTVIDDPAAAEASLDPIRARLLAELAEPGSASTLAARGGLTRQKANYHLRALERHGLVELVEERRKGNCTERVLRATAASYVISPTALAAVAPDPDREPDPRSARRPLAGPGPGGRVVGGRRAHGPRGRRAHLRVAGGREAARDPGHRQRGAVRVREAPGRVRRRAGRRRERTRRQVPRRGRVRRPLAPVRRRPPPHHHEAEGARVMSRAFEITREVDLPASPDDVWTAITADTAAW